MRMLIPHRRLRERFPCPRPLPILASALALTAALGAFAAGTHVLIRACNWRATQLTAPALVAMLCAAARLCLAWGEIPIGTLALHLA